MTLRVTPQEREALRRAAKRAGLSTSEYVRGTALGDLTRSTRPSTAGAASP